MIGGYAVNRTRGVDRVVPDGSRDNTGSVSILYGGFLRSAGCDAGFIPRADFLLMGMLVQPRTYMDG